MWWYEACNVINLLEKIRQKLSKTWVVRFLQARVTFLFICAVGKQILSILLRMSRQYFQKIVVLEFEQVSCLLKFCFVIATAFTENVQNMKPMQFAQVSYFVNFLRLYTYMPSSCFLFVCFVALRPKLTAKVMAGRSVQLTTLFPGQSWTSR